MGVSPNPDSRADLACDPACDSAYGVYETGPEFYETAVVSVLRMTVERAGANRSTTSHLRETTPHGGARVTAGGPEDGSPSFGNLVEGVLHPGLCSRPSRFSFESGRVDLR